MKHSIKSEPIEAFLLSYTGKDRRSYIMKGLCMTCPSTGNIATSFTDDVSRKEYGISAMCQKCQDDIFEVADDE
jgi:hypothetical protein|tara:strand:- start:637 stop:858 length:222 start_codon:yes stop_codon:yes gene_type:complete